MGVRRTALPFEGRFTQVPNAWLRDKRLSRKARGLLVEIMSHQVGWHVSLAGLREGGPEGRDAIETGLLELRNLGYLKLERPRGAGGRFAEVEYELCDPADTASGFSVSGSSASGSSASGKSAPIRTPSEEHHQEEDQTPSLIAGDEVVELISLDAAFESFWHGYPRKKSKGDAHKAFGVLWGKVPPSGRLAWLDNVKRGLIRSMAEWRREGRAVEKIPYPATWLRAEGWMDEPDPVPPSMSERDDIPLWIAGRRVR